MIASGCPSNQVLQMLDAADLDLLRPHLATVEMVRKSVLSEAGSALKYVYFPHGGSVSITVGPSEGQMIEVAMLGRDSVVGGGAALSDGIAPIDAVVYAGVHALAGGCGARATCPNCQYIPTRT
ncbi:hypothetical protein WHZ78_01350 [Bradyrhizobium symbiodeficiens]|uniref:hypothetical protein n=1 Tax=Bradyrhizobium symbiodeficiens TaxID=1404367 RepID=UPI0030D36902